MNLETGPTDGLQPIVDMIRAQGNVRELTQQEIPIYLASLKIRLNNLRDVVEREDREYAVNFVQGIKDSIECLGLKYALQFYGDDKIDFPLTIDPLISGLPTAKDFYLLESNKREANSMLSQMPSREEIIDKIRKAVLRGDSVSTPQFLLAKHNLYSKIAASEVLSSYAIRSVKKTKEKDGRKYFAVEWSCIERGSSFPVFYRLGLTQDSRLPELEIGSNPRLEMVLYQTQTGVDDISSFASFVDREIEEVHPKSIERYIVGPFMNKFTQNAGGFSNILNGEEDSSVLKFTVERAISVDVNQYGNLWDAIRGRKTEREVFGPVDSETELITAFRLKQKMIGVDGNNKPCNIDEKGVPCKIYGVTNSGEIV